MDFSSVCLDTMLGGNSNSNSNNNHGHGQLKHLRSGSDMDLDPHDWRSSSKMARTESYIPALMRATSTSVMSDTSNNSGGGAADLLESDAAAAARLMRSDSIVSPFTNNNSNKSLSLPFYHHGGGGAVYQYSAAAHKPHGMHGVARMSPFTASQWQELEHQAMIFRYMMAGVQVPPELLISMRKTNSMNVNLFSNLAGSLRPNLGWSSFHLGFGNNADPEPGRCRRTDGKKWRCSRDAVPDQKYCERHMNRGRHRSRKPVEGQTQTPAAAAPSTASGAAVSSTSLAAAAAAAARGSVTPNNNNNTSSFSNLRPSMAAAAAQSQLKPSSAFATIDAATPFQIPLNVDRYLFESPSSFNDAGWRPSRIAPPRPPPPVPKPSAATTNLMGLDDAPDFGLGHMNMSFGRDESHRHDERRSCGAVRHFFDDWPMRSAAATQLSISIPSEFSPSSPNNKLTLSPLKLSTSRSDDPMGVDVALGVGMGLGIEPEQRHRHPHGSWIPIAWESPVGGPLAEVLNSAAPPHEKNNNHNNSSSTSVLNLMTGDATWDCSSSGSPRGDTSPTGVLQKTLGSLSDNSSTGSSPRAVKPLAASLCENLRTAAFAQLSAT